MVDSQKLPLYLILSRKLVPQNKKFLKDLIVQRNGWLPKWRKIARNVRHGCVLRGHLIDTIKNWNKQILICDNPGDSISQLQPLDVCINKTFKNNKTRIRTHGYPCFDHFWETQESDCFKDLWNGYWLRKKCAKWSNKIFL